MTNLLEEGLAGSDDPRGERPAITPLRLGAIWPEARTRVIRHVACRGADPQTAEDIAQEVALRAIDNHVGFHDVDDFCGWAYRVARNLLVDQQRSRGRLVGMVDLPDQADGRDVHGEVEQRMTLVRVVRAFKDLGESDRAAILAGVNETGEPSRKVAVRTAVRRHRARARLLRMVEGVAAFWTLVRSGRRWVPLAPVAVAACGVLLVPAVVKRLDSAPSPDGAGRRPVELLHGERPPAQALRADDSDRLGGGRQGAGVAGSPVGGEAPRRMTNVARIPTPQGDAKVDLVEEPQGNDCLLRGSAEGCIAKKPGLPEPRDVLPQNSVNP